VLELMEDGYDIVAVDNFFNSVKGDGSELPESLRRVEKYIGRKMLGFYNVDLCDKKAMMDCFSKHKIDCVMHFAAAKAVAESVREPLMYYSNNVNASTTLLQVMQENGCNRIVFSSSASVYGSPEYLPIDENHPVGSNIMSPYGMTKYVTERVIRDLHRARPEWGAVFLRYFNPAGAHLGADIGEEPQGIPNNLMPYIAQVAVGVREKLSVFGGDWDTPDGTCTRDYIHIIDLAKGHVHAMKLLFGEESNKIWAYNLGTGKPHSVLDVLKAFEGATGKKIPYEIVGRRTGDIDSLYAATKLVEKELGWQAKFTMKDMCSDLWTWQQKNPKGYNPNKENK